MKHLSFAFIVLMLFVVACKKKASTPVPITTMSPVWNLNKIWYCDGHKYYSSHPSNMDPAHTYKDTTVYTNNPLNVLVIDDTSIVVILPPATVGDTMWHFKTDSTFQYIEFIPKIWKQIGTRYRGTFLKYYYVADSIHFYYDDYGVSFDTQTNLYSK